MDFEKRVKAFYKLGEIIRTIPEQEFQTLAENVRNENPWFVGKNIRIAFDSIIQFLIEEKLIKWLSIYPKPASSKRVAVVMAGNIPLVGFHDFMSIMLMGHIAVVKLSSKDSVLIKFIIGKLLSIESEFSTFIQIEEQFKNFDAVIATGSDNSSRYFEYYFSKYPHIIRRNRTSAALLDGQESDEMLEELGKDVFTYFGLGCRNVSKLYIPADYDLTHLLDVWEKYNPIIHHHKYCNNYDYQKSILLVNRVPFLDNGFVLLQESDRLVSPISVLYYERYVSIKDFEDKITANKEKIQCLVGNSHLATIPFGQAQYPSLTDYADNIDTLKFLSELN